MKLVLMAGGRGVRLKPLTDNMPKPMIPLNGKPMLQYNIEWARENGIKEIIICCGYLSEKIKDYFGDGSSFGVDIKYAVEDKPLGTAGALRNAKQFLDSEDFILLYADVLCKVNFKKIMQLHKDFNAVCTLAVQHSSHPYESDLIELQGKKVLKFLRRPHMDLLKTDLGNAGLHVVNPKIFEMIPEGKCSLENEILPALVTDSKVAGYFTTEFLEDMGKLERLKKFEQKIKSKGWNFL
ncbi:MAG: nucleotidyltransferase family protein [Nanoarchaeota archaeon]|nr:nucleotidyltransferase family protein [Nanoarchaeota archaeon]